MRSRCIVRHWTMVQGGRGLRLALEALTRLRVVKGALGQELQRDVAVQAAVFGLVDVAHSASAKLGLDAGDQGRCEPRVVTEGSEHGEIDIDGLAGLPLAQEPTDAQYAIIGTTGFVWARHQRSYSANESKLLTKGVNRCGVR